MGIKKGPGCVIKHRHALKQETKAGGIHAQSSVWQTIAELLKEQEGKARRTPKEEAVPWKINGVLLNKKVTRFLKHEVRGEGKDCVTFSS